jgi:hypothetical protein
MCEVLESCSTSAGNCELCAASTQPDVSYLCDKYPARRQLPVQEPAVRQDVLDRQIAKYAVVPTVPPVILTSKAQKLSDQLAQLDADLVDTLS